VFALAAWLWREKLKAIPILTMEPREEDDGAVAASLEIPREKLTAPAICSFLLPGLGQVIKGETGRGLAFFAGWIVGLFVMVVPGIIVWIWAIKDAYHGQPLALAASPFQQLMPAPLPFPTPIQQPQRTEWLDVASPDGRFKLAGNLRSEVVRVWDAHVTDFVATHRVPMKAIAEGLHVTESGAVVFGEVEDLAVLVARIRLLPVSGDEISVKLGALVQDIETGRDNLVGVVTCRSNRPDHSRKFIVLDGSTGNMLHSVDLDDGGRVRFWGERVVMVTTNQAGEEKRETLWKREA
jgi:hypothetical protein